ncbi:Hypothetical predicted protein [Paramuricea clavata]|uniref:Uncharacterized protein n=1 Tax=Paramuricea clavata TaxID=317549 RepID=A0A7D9HK57_PARCT|nr:Hypothetical predicted protein [Paramuricea clavata]
MSTQNGILGILTSQKLWTAPSKEQYLPAYFKEICDEYLLSEDKHRVYPVECLGLQRNSRPATCVIGSDFHVQIVDGKAKRILPSESPYSVIENIPFVRQLDFEGDLDGGKSLIELIELMEHYMKDNFLATLLVLGGLGIGVHYDQLNKKSDRGVPLIMAYGQPVSGKSTTMSIAMSILGHKTSIGELTSAGALKLTKGQTLPFWWDDASDFSVLEELAVSSYNNSIKQTAYSKPATSSRTNALITMNPNSIPKKIRGDKQMIRVFSQIAVIPFKEINEEQNLETCMFLDEKLKTITTHLAKSVGVFLELAPQFDVMHQDQMFIQILSEVKKNKLDVRAQFNYSLLLYSTGKPSSSRIAETPTLTNDMTAILIAIVTSATKNPIENASRSHIRTSRLGCNGVRINVGEGQPKGSHIQRNKLPEAIIQNLDKVFPDAKKLAEINQKQKSSATATGTADKKLPEVLNDHTDTGDKDQHEMSENDDAVDVTSYSATLDKIRRLIQQPLPEVNLGVLHKNEQYEEDMVDIVSFLHKYVPGHDEASSERKPRKGLEWRDYLTFQRHTEAQSAMQDADFCKI